MKHFSVFPKFKIRVFETGFLRFAECYRAKC